MKKSRFMKSLALILAAGLAVFGFASCKNSDDDDSSSSSGTSMKIALYGADSSKTWNVWAWKELGNNDTNYDSKAWPGGTYQLKDTDENGCVCLHMNIDTSVDLGILFVASSGSPQTDDIIVPKSVLQSTKELYFTYSNMNYYTNFSDMAGLQSAKITSADCNTVTAKIVTDTEPQPGDITVKDKNGVALTVTSVSLSGLNATITLSDGEIAKIPYTVTYSGVSVTANIENDLIDEIFTVPDSTELGLSLSGTSAGFKMWAPLADKVQLALYADASKVSSDKNATLKDMTFDSASGIWEISDVDVSSFKYYKYAIKYGGSTQYVCDIWAKAASPDSVASQIADISSDSDSISSGTKDTSWGTQAGYYSPFTGTTYSEAVIYEMHIRDWSRAVDSSSTGKFTELASEAIINHLKDLGVTHVQILPMFDYAQLNSDSEYNWGYNPYHYNVPEGRYVSSGYTDGTQAVKEARQMIAALHDAGIAVIMDVVYNHTNGTGKDSLYDMTVPGYFYRLDSDGNYTNGSGCGNEIATNHAMVKRYVIESLKHWMLDYHVNGFRFDLMGCLEADTMKEIYDELYKIDPKVMVYGEPWTGGASAVQDGAVQAGKGTSGSGYGAFDDDFRDAVKGAEFGGFQKGQVQGTYKDSGIISGLLGKSGSNNRNATGNPALSLHYVECHDNYTLFDKLAISALGKTSYSGDLFSAASAKLDSIKAQDMLAASYVLLSQGTPFINGGQEFLRTKQGDENSYKSSDKINQIDFSMKETYGDVYKTYKGLIALRKANPTAFGANTEAEAETVSTGVTKYTAGDFLVYFNATDAAVSITTSGYTKHVDVSGGTATEDTTLPATVAAKSFVILKK